MFLPYIILASKIGDHASAGSPSPALAVIVACYFNDAHIDFIDSCCPTAFLVFHDIRYWLLGREMNTRIDYKTGATSLQQRPGTQL